MILVSIFCHLWQVLRGDLHTIHAWAIIQQKVFEALASLTSMFYGVSHLFLSIWDAKRRGERERKEMSTFFFFFPSWFFILWLLQKVVGKQEPLWNPHLLSTHCWLLTCLETWKCLNWEKCYLHPSHWTMKHFSPSCLFPAYICAV